MEITPIGIFHTAQIYPYEAGRQNDEFHQQGIIELFKGQNFEQALEGLEQFSHVWVLFEFHHNQNWKPKVLPPRGTTHKVGVFATRAPYRPNAIGMSAVKIQKIQGLKIFIESADLLDQSPILDIKPYIPVADSIPEATMGWIDDIKYTIQLDSLAAEQLDFLEKHGVLNLKNFIQHQLEYQPTDHRRKRLANEGNFWILAYRTWRVRFKILEQVVVVTEIQSGYSEQDLADGEDPYQDKDLHRRFLKK